LCHGCSGGDVRYGYRRRGSGTVRAFGMLTFEGLRKWTARRLRCYARKGETDSRLAVQHLPGLCIRGHCRDRESDRGRIRENPERGPTGPRKGRGLATSGHGAPFLSPEGTNEEGDRTTHPSSPVGTAERSRERTGQPSLRDYLTTCLHPNPTSKLGGLLSVVPSGLRAPCCIMSRSLATSATERTRSQPDWQEQGLRQGS